jgi:predicted secreted protein
MNNIMKYLKWIVLVIALIGIYFFVRVVMIGDVGKGDSLDEEKDKALRAVVSNSINYTMIIIVLTTIIAVIWSMFSLLKDPKNLKKVLIGLVALAVIFTVTYFMSDSSGYVGKEFTIEEGSVKSKMISAGINFSLVLGTIAFFGFIFETVKNIIKNN